MQRIRSWCFTINIPSHENWEDYDYLEHIECTYIVYGQEIAPTTNQKHIQGFVHFKEGKTLTAVKRIMNCPFIHLEAKRGTFKQASDYCKKEGAFTEVGTLPADPADKGQASKDMWSEIVKHVEDRDMDYVKENYPKVYVTQIGNLQKVAAAAAKKVDSISHYPGWFISGEAGSGKTRFARHLAGERGIFSHPKGDWWDGYNGEQVILFDDVTPEEAKPLIGKFKCWLDLHAFSAPIKGVTGGTGFIRPTTFILTSNYTLRELFPRLEDFGAMLRRFPNERYQPNFNWNEEHVNRLMELEQEPAPAFMDRDAGLIRRNEAAQQSASARNFIAP